MRLSGSHLIAALFVVACANDVSAPTASIAPPPAAARVTAPAIALAVLPTLGGYSEVFSINDAGIAVGYSTFATGPAYPYAVRWSLVNGKWTLEQFGEQSTRASAINDGGTVVGDYGRDAVVWPEGGAMQVLGPGEANGVNPANVVVGIRHDVGLQAPAAWRVVSGAWTVTSLKLVPGTSRNEYCVGQATSISNTGVIVGYLFDSNCDQQYAVKWMPEANPADGWEPAEILEDAAGMVKSFAYAIEGNTVVGEAWPCQQLSGCARRAYRWSLTPGSLDTGPIGTLDARANGINLSGTAAGSYIESKKMRAVVWAPASSAYVTLPAVNKFNMHWVWDINNATANRATRFAVGGGRSESGDSAPLVWTLP